MRSRPSAIRLNNACDDVKAALGPALTARPYQDRRRVRGTGVWRCPGVRAWWRYRRASTVPEDVPSGLANVLCLCSNRSAAIRTLAGRSGISGFLWRRRHRI